MSQYRERTYRARTHSRDMKGFRVTVKETDLWVSADREIEKETLDLVLDCRRQLETYIKDHPEFVTSLGPYEEDPYAPPLVRDMIRATRMIGVGPMASVAGAVAQYVGESLLELSRQVVVENGGDIFLKADRPVTVSILAGSSPLSEKVGISVPTKWMPLGVCSSSGVVGHSLSMGIADVVCILSRSAALADGAATALGNRVKKRGNLEDVSSWARNIEGILGGVVIVQDRMAAWGEIELVTV